MSSPSQISPQNSSWLRTFTIGFSIISFGITIAIIGYFILTTKQNQQKLTPSPILTQPSPTPSDKTENWPMYHSDEFGFEVNYSPAYRMTEVSSKDTYPEMNYESHISSFQKGLRFVGQNQQLFCSTVEILIYNNEGGSLDEWLQIHSEVTRGFGRSDKVTQNDVQFYRYSYPAGDLVPGNMYVAANAKGYIFQINILANLSGYESAQECGNILSTFRFID